MLSPFQMTDFLDALEASDPVTHPALNMYSKKERIKDRELRYSIENRTIVDSWEGLSTL